MAKSKLPNNIDFEAGFFSNTGSTGEVNEKIIAPVENKLKKEDQNIIGRPPKKGLKNKQFTLTMDPELYEKLRIVASQYTNNNFSRLVDEAVKLYCKEHEINLADINVSSEILEMYRKKQQDKKISKNN